MTTINIGEIDIHYEEDGTGDVVVLAAGLGGTADYWDPQFEVLSRKYRVIRYDHRGTGQSTRWEGIYSVDQMAEDLIGLLDRLKIERAYLIGHSTGGAIGQTIAATMPHRLRGMVLSNSWTRADAFVRWCFSVRSELLQSGGAAAYMRATPLFLLTPEYIRDNAEAVEAATASAIETAASVSILQARIDAVLAFDRTADLATMNVPTLVTTSSDDVLTPPYFSIDLERGIPGATLHTFSHGGHAISRTRPDAYNTLIMDWLSAQRN